MKTLKVQDIHVASYETFAGLAERLPGFIEDALQCQAAALSPWLGIASRI